MLYPKTIFMAHFNYSEFQTSVQNYFGDPYVSFTIKVEKDGKTAALLTPMSELRKFLRINHPKEHDYIQTIRKGIIGYGPKEDKILEILEDEEFPIENFVIDYWDNSPGVVESEIKRQARPFDLETHEKLLGFLAEMEQKLDTGDSVSINGLSDELHELVANYCIKRFPQIIESEPKDITGFNELLLNQIPKLATAVVNFLDDINI